MKETGMMGTWADACINPNCISALPGPLQRARNKMKQSIKAIYDAILAAAERDELIVVEPVADSSTSIEFLCLVDSMSRSTFLSENAISLFFSLSQTLCNTTGMCHVAARLYYCVAAANSDRAVG